MKKIFTVAISLLSVLAIFVAGVWKVFDLAYDKSFESLHFIYGGQVSSLERRLENERNQFDKEINRLRYLINSMEGGVSYNVGGELEFRSPGDFLVSREDAKRLVGQGRFIDIRNFIAYDYTAFGYKAFSGRLFQLMKLLHEDVMPLPDGEPDDENNPLWWVECWSFHKSNDGKEGGGGPVFSQGTIMQINQDTSKRLLTAFERDKDDRLRESLPRLIRLLNVILEVYDEKDTELEVIQYNKDIVYVTGTAGGDWPDSDMRHKFYLIGIQNGEETYFITSSYTESVGAIDPVIDDARNFISGFKIINEGASTTTKSQSLISTK